MKIKIDENLPRRLAVWLSESGHDARTAGDEGIAGKVDSVVWEAAQGEARFLITQDMDFSDARRFKPGTHYGILLIRLRTPSRRALIQRVENLFRTERVSEWTRCFVVATDRKVRVRRPR